MNRKLALLILALAALAGCTGPNRRLPGAIHHTVFIALSDPQDAAELASDCRELRTIPGLTGWAVGTPVSSGRSTVDSSYDVGVYVGFGSVAAYQTYVDHPIHVRLVTKWRPRWKSIQVRDFGGP